MRPRTWFPIRSMLLGASVYALSLACWQFLIVPRLQPATLHLEADTSKIDWYAGIGPFLRRGNFEKPETLILGDSRVNDGIVLEELESHGIARPSIIWAASARLVKLLTIARQLPARRLVVALSVRSLEGARGDPIAIALLGEVPPLTTEDLDARLEKWKKDQVEFMMRKGGFEREQVVLVLDQMARMHREGLLNDAPTTAGFDRRLGNSVANSLSRYVRRLSTKTWGDSWMPVIDPASSNAVYLEGIEHEMPGTREYTENQVIALLRGLVADGFQIVCLRMPVSAELRAIEETVFSQEDFAALAKKSGVEFLDYSRADLKTRDGSHLLADDARRFSRILAADLLARFE